eukprot:10622080-Alexandrium_andersonii.AAC.1
MGDLEDSVVFGAPLAVAAPGVSPALRRAGAAIASSALSGARGVFLVAITDSAELAAGDLYSAAA